MIWILNIRTALDPSDCAPKVWHWSPALHSYQFTISSAWNPGRINLRGLEARGTTEHPVGPEQCIDSAGKDFKIAFAQALSGIFLKVKRRR